MLDWSLTPLSLRVEELRASDSHSVTWRSLALRCLQGKVTIFCGSIASLQAAVMLLLDGQEELSNLDALLVTAISGARKLGLHGLGDAKLEISIPSDTFIDDSSRLLQETVNIRTEIGIRIW